MNTKKILYITPALPVGGAERFLIALSSRMKAWTNRQYILSLSDQNKLQNEVDPAVEFMAWPRQSKFDLAPLRRLRKFVKQEQPDIIFCINFFSYFVARMALLGIKKQPRTIISYHSTKHLTRKEHWLHWLYIKMLRQNDEVICVSQKQADYTFHTYRLRATQVRVVLNGVDTDYWKPADSPAHRTAIRHELAIPASAPVIILTAAFRPEKNHLGAIRVLKHLHTQHHLKAYLLFVGDGPMRSGIEAEIKRQELGEYVKLAGLQSHVLPYYHAADIFTLVSDNVETFSIAALEAMSCGLPLVLTNVGGASEMITEGVNGFLATACEKNIAANWEKALQANLSSSDIHQFAVEHFRIEKMLMAYKKLLQLPS